MKWEKNPDWIEQSKAQLKYQLVTRKEKFCLKSASHYQKPSHNEQLSSRTKNSHPQTNNFASQAAALSSIIFPALLALTGRHAFFYPFHTFTWLANSGITRQTGKKETTTNCHENRNMFAIRRVCASTKFHLVTRTSKTKPEHILSELRIVIWTGQNVCWLTVWFVDTWPGCHIHLYSFHFSRPWWCSFVPIVFSLADSNGRISRTHTHIHALQETLLFLTFVCIHKSRKRDRDRGKVLEVFAILNGMKRTSNKHNCVDIFRISVECVCWSWPLYNGRSFNSPGPMEKKGVNLINIKC